MICHGCGGEKFLKIGFTHPHRGLSTVPCDGCGGTGELPDKAKDWRGIGRQMKADRKRRGETLRTESRRRGIDPALLSKMERGFCEPVTE